MIDGRRSPSKHVRKHVTFYLDIDLVDYWWSLASSERMSMFNKLIRDHMNNAPKLMNVDARLKEVNKKLDYLDDRVFKLEKNHERSFIHGMGVRR